VSYTVSVPFERFAQLKHMIAGHTGDWQGIDEERDAFERRWQPASWGIKRRFVFVRQRVAVQQREPLQLDLFEPRDYRHEYKVVVTNKRDPMADLVLCHEGRGAQEGLFAELKSENGLAYVPTNTWAGQPGVPVGGADRPQSDARADDAHRHAGADTDHQTITALGLPSHGDGTSRNVAAGRAIDQAARQADALDGSERGHSTANSRRVAIHRACGVIGLAANFGL